VSASVGAERIQDPPVRPLDRAFEQRINRQLERIQDRGDYVDLVDLQGQLSRATVALDLPEARTRALSGAEIYEVALPSVVTVSKRFLCGKCNHWHESHASGFALADGVVATNHHVVATGAEGILAVACADGALHPVAEVLAADEAADLAIVRLAGDGPFPPPLPLGAPPPVGTPVFSLSHPDGHYYFFSEGRVARWVQHRSEGRLLPRLEITADYAKGSSGGAVLDAMGNVVSVIAATSSVYYEEDPNDALQMVFKYTVPATSLRRLVAAPASGR